MNLWSKLGFLACVVFVAGCGGGIKEEKTDVVQISPVDIIKLTVEGVAKTGADMGSGEDSLREAIEELKKTDAAKASAIEGEFVKMTKARDATSRKAAAKSLLTKL